MSLVVSSKYRNHIKIINWVLVVFGMITGFIIMPPYIAVALSLILFFVGKLIDKLVFRYIILHFAPIPSLDALTNRIGSLWGFDDYKGKEYIVFGQLFKTKTVAAAIFNCFRKWNFMDFIDRNQNIILTIVDEGENKFTFLLYPGDRMIKEYHSMQVKLEYGPNSEAKTLLLYM